jgi:hypothetical protein
MGSGQKELHNGKWIIRSGKRRSGKLKADNGKWQMRGGDGKL